MKKQPILIKKKLLQLFQLNRQNPIQKNNNLVEIFSDLNLIKYVYSRLKYKQQNIFVKAKIINKTDFKILKQLSKQIQTGSYTWNSDKMIKNKNTFTLKNQIIQKLLNIILKTIYEPVFQTLNFNFNDKKQPEVAIKQLKIQNQTWTYAFKNKIYKINFSLRHKLIIKILKKKITDPIFLKLLKNFLKKNVLRKKTYFILHNIYVHEFDLYLSKKIKNMYKNITQSLPKIEFYYKYKIKEEFAKQKFFQWKIKWKKKVKFKVKKFQKLKTYIKNSKKKWIQIQIQNKRNQISEITYNRYNTNWLMLTTSTLNQSKRLKNKLVKWFNKNLQLNLKNIMIINLIKSRVNYLGFTLFTISPKIKKNYYWNKIKMRKKKKITLFVGIDHKYIKNKLIKKGILTLKNKLKPINSYCSLKPLNILKKFRQKLKILINYYYNVITHPSDLNYYYYIYKFSYLKTLAQKMKKSITYISKFFF